MESPAGIGLFIVLVGLKGAGIVISSTATLVDLGRWNTTVCTAMIGFFCILCYGSQERPSAVLWGTSSSRSSRNYRRKDWLVPSRSAAGALTSTARFSFHPHRIGQFDCLVHESD